MACVQTLTKELKKKPKGKTQYAKICETFFDFEYKIKLGGGLYFLIGFKKVLR